MAKKLRDDLKNANHKERARLRARDARKAIRDAFVGNEPVRVRTVHGDISIARIEDGPDGTVNVFLDGETQSGEVHFRIVNPPTLALDPSGDIELHGQRYREDPLAAIAEAIAMHGGVRSTKKRRVI